MERLGDFKITTIFDDDYPEFLAKNPLRPLCIFTRGEFRLLSFLDDSIGIHAGALISDAIEDDVYTIIQAAIKKDVVFIHSSLYPLTHLVADAALDDAKSFTPRIVVVPFCDEEYDASGLIISEVPFPDRRNVKGYFKNEPTSSLLSDRVLLADMEESSRSRFFDDGYDVRKEVVLLRANRARFLQTIGKNGG